ncbi:uncharacterized protein LOC116291892 isoform X1 [Actinia tenebrosa]|uniref:Uncharacterized protein LOC116291892 isoform X1 n=1 Tax=Actinia tenebrosa TaxID=6105 RepID=A0A6P8HQQ4_ACTTE|nr:uncharacterized protein LOC116291892 isoform X1 [Actinia tenebrosa]
MADTRAAVPSAVRSWYTEKKGGMMDRTSAPVNFQTIVRPDITRLGCGIHVIPGDGTYVTSHYGTMPGGNVLNDEIQIPTAKAPEPACQIKSGQREKCGNVSSPFMTPDVCLKAGCCYDDVFMDEPDVNWYSSEGSTWCYKGKKQDTGKQTIKTKDLETQNVDNNETSVNTSMAKTNNLESQNSLDDNGEPKGFFKDCLDQHNKLRAKHGVPPLKWSKKLADNALRVAKMNADLGRMKHDPKNNNEGENLAYFGPPQPKCEGPKVGNCFQCREVVDDWYSEIKDYDFAAGKSRNGGVVLHFTLIVWRKTTEMGMATAVGNNKVFSVARYSEKGNMLPEENFVKNVPPLGSGPLPTSQPESTVSKTGSVSPTGTTSAGASGSTPTFGSSTSSITTGGAGGDCYGNSCYSFNGEGKTWKENREECKKKGGDLVSMETDGEWTFLKDKIQGLSNQLRNEWHIGLKKDGSTWKWVNDAPLTITHWQRGEPSGDGPYVVMAKDYPPGTQGQFNDLADYVPSGFICETTKEANTSPTSGGTPPTPQPPTNAISSAATSSATTPATTAATNGATGPTSSSPTTDMEAEGNDCFGSSCYSFNGEGQKWTENREECKKKGGDLVSMETDGEWKFLKDKIQGLSNQLRNEWHIGLKKDGSTWKWVNDAPLTITHWQRGEPSGDGPYVVMAKDYPPGTQGQFNDLADYVPSGYICETTKGASTSPTVPSGAITPTPQPPSSGVTSATTAATAGATTSATTAAVTGASTGVGATSSAEPKGFFKDCLDQHNKLRAKHGVPPLKWSKKLADNALRVAKMNADLGRMKHDPKNNNEGENLAYFGPPQPKCEGPKVGNCFQCREVVDDWYSEIKDYDFAAGKSRNGGVVLHFTQVVWRKTTEMGMATAVGNNKVFSVARYSEKGNMLPEENFVKNVPPLV